MQKSVFKGIFMILFLLLPFVAGCTIDKPLTDEDANIYQRVHKQYSAMESYTATVRLTVFAGEQAQTYVLRQSVQGDKALSLLVEPASLAGFKTLYENGKVTLRSPLAEQSLTLPAAEELDTSFVHHFFKRYYSSEETAVSVSANESEGRGDLLLETAMVPATGEMHSITLGLNRKTLEPNTITVFDMGGNIRMMAEFSDFCYNPKIDQKTFTIEK